MVALPTPSKVVSPLLRAIGEDRHSITYRPTFAHLTGSATAAILLQQIFYWWEISHYEPFFKFKLPSKHEKYKEGDSWCEELCFTRAEFDNALAHIGTKIKRGKSKQSAMDWKMPRLEDFAGQDDGFQAAIKIAVEHIIVYWTDGSRRTWFDINHELMTDLLNRQYDCEKGAKEGKSLYLDKAENKLLIGKEGKSLYLYSETTQRLHIEKEKTLADQKASADLKTDPVANPVAKIIEPEPKPESQPDNVKAFQAALEPKEKGSGEKEKVSPAPQGQYVPPAGYERLYVSRQIDQESRANVEHLVLASSSTPTPKCKRCGLVLADGQVSQLPTPGTNYVRCLGDEPKKARASPKEPAEHDPLFDWCARHLIGNDPAAVYVDKELIGWCWKLVSKIVNAEKHLTGAKSLNMAARKAVEGKLPGFLWYFSVQCKGCSLSDTKKFAKWINKWYEAGCPQSNKPEPDLSDYVSEIDTTKGKLYAVPAK